MTDIQEKPDPYFEGLLRHRDVLLSLRTDQLKTFDKAILGVSGGALGISIAFVDKFSGQTPQFTAFLFLSWMSFAAAIFLNICSYLTSSQDATREVQKIDACLRTAEDYKTGGNVFNSLTFVLNIAAVLLFLAGIILLAVHAYRSMNGG